MRTLVHSLICLPNRSVNVIDDEFDGKFTFPNAYRETAKLLVLV